MGRTPYGSAPIHPELSALKAQNSTGANAASTHSHPTFRPFYAVESAELVPVPEVPVPAVPVPDVFPPSVQLSLGADPFCGGAVSVWLGVAVDGAVLVTAVVVVVASAALAVPTNPDPNMPPTIVVPAISAVIPAFCSLLIDISLPVGVNEIRLPIEPEQTIRQRWKGSVDIAFDD